MKSFLISIHPGWIIKIFNGEKIAEIRKDAPKDWKDYLSGKTKKKPEPMTGYIYCTNGKPYVAYIDGKLYTQSDSTGRGPSPICFNGKVVASFTLREVERIYRVGAWDEDPCVDAFATNKMDYDELLNKSCLKEAEMDEYLTSDKEFVGYAYHISELQIFDKPKELSEFKHPYLSCGRYCGNNFVPSFCRLHCSHNTDPERLDVLCDRNDKWGKPITKAPQSWCYVEELE